MQNKIMNYQKSRERRNKEWASHLQALVIKSSLPVSAPSNATHRYTRSFHFKQISSRNILLVAAKEHTSSLCSL